MVEAKIGSRAGWVCAALLGVSTSAWGQGQQLEIDVLFYDFNGTNNIGDKSSGVGLAPDPANQHPDFEYDDGHCWDVLNQASFPIGLGHSILDPGIVQNTLGVDGVPVHSGSSNSTNNDPALFDKWFKSDPAYNVPVSQTLVLDQIGTSNVFGIDTAEFFPLDGKGLGNTISLDADGRTPDCGLAPFFTGVPIESGHNWHWTMQVSTEFIYEGGETFSFRGDDDMWVFINGELALDLGGLHAADAASAPFVSGDINLDDILSPSDIGQAQQFDLFFAERYHNDSNFKMETSIPIGNIISGLVGDYSGDGFVSQADLDLVLLNWGDTVLPAGFDVNGLDGGGPFDGLMSQNELDGVLLNWGDGTPPILAIPEPTSAALLALGAAATMRRRRM